MNELVVLEHANRMLAEVRDARSAKQLMDKAEAVEHYARRTKLSQETITYAHTIKIDAMRLLGGYLAEADSAAGRPKITTDGEVISRPPALAELGISWKESSAAQFLNDIAAKFPELFEEIRNGDKTLTAVRREVRRAEVAETAQLPSDKYRVFYADPPWRYGDQLTEDYGPTKYHYPAMSIPDLCALPVAGLAEDDAVLFIWTTSPMLEATFPVIHAWGFSYRTSFVWDKVKHNMGHYNSVRHEFLLVAVRGSCLPDVPKLYDSVFSIERGAHSAKPADFRQMIDALYPYGNRLELFAREKAEGWSIWGNQCDVSEAV